MAARRELDRGYRRSGMGARNDHVRGVDASFIESALFQPYPARR